jgi:hypothetical protein
VRRPARIPVTIITVLALLIVAESVGHQVAIGTGR